MAASAQAGCSPRPRGAGHPAPRRLRGALRDDAFALLLLVQALDDELLEQGLIADVARGGQRAQAFERELVEADRDRSGAAGADRVLHLANLLALGLRLEKFIGVEGEAFGRVYDLGFATGHADSLSLGCVRT